MARESPTFRLELEQINAKFNGAAFLTVTDVAEYLGHSRAWCRKHLGINGKRGMTAVELAQAISAR